MVVESAGPRLRGELRPAQEGAVGAVEDVIEPVAVGGDDQLARPTVDRRVHEHRNLVGVPVVRVVWRELEVPAERAGRRIQRNQRAAVQVVALAGVAVPVRRRIPDAPVEQVEFRIVGAGQPRRRASSLPALTRPRLVTRLAGSWNGLKAPCPRAGLRVVGIDETADAGLAAADADHDLAVDGERRGGDRVAERVVGHLDVPPHGARRGVERHQVRVQCADEHTIVQQRHAAVHRTEPDEAHVLRHRRLVAPERAPAAQVQRGDAALCFGDIHHAVGDERCRFDLPRLLHLVHPLRPQPGDVGRRDLGQRREAMPRVRARVGEPRAGLAARRANPLVRNLRIGDARAQTCEERERTPAHVSHRSTVRVIRNATRSSRSRPFTRSR